MTRAEIQKEWLRGYIAIAKLMNDLRIDGSITAGLLLATSAALSREIGHSKDHFIELAGEAYDKPGVPPPHPIEGGMQ